MGIEDDISDENYDNDDDDDEDVIFKNKNK